MMLCPGANTTTIGRLRVRSRSSDPQAEEQRVARLLRSATLHPSGLPESAVLVVRQLADPLPARLRAGPWDTTLDSSWQFAVAAALERLAASAPRPAYQAVPAGSDAVLFFDRAEILASLARSWMNGVMSGQWWWQEFLRDRGGITALLREWIEQPQYVPAAIELMSLRGEGTRFLQRLPEQATNEMIQALVKTFALPVVAAEEPIEHLALPPGPERGPSQPARPEKAPSNTNTAFGIFMRRWVEDIDAPGLLPSARVLLVQALMLRRAPAVVRTVSFQRELSLWMKRTSGSEPWQERDEIEVQKPIEVPAGAASANWSDRKGLSPAAAGDVESGIGDRPGVKEDEPMVSSVTRADSDGAQEIHLPAGVDPARTSARSESATSGDQLARETVAGQPQLEGKGISAQEPALIGDSAVDVPVSQDCAPQVCFETEYGGIFFLLAMALHLYIYGDFTRPADPGLELNIWDFLALVGSRLTDGEMEKDPIWERLAALAGRAALVNPGQGFRPPNEWKVPTEWLEAFPDECPEPSRVGGRLIARHPAGFTAIDVPAVPDAVGVDSLGRWVGWMAEYFRARLVRAIGRDDAVQLTCRRRASVVLTLTHVDVTFELHKHPIELRMAGLDRDLGWIPAAGRYVAFHFR